MSEMAIRIAPETSSGRLTSLRPIAAIRETAAQRIVLQY
jgi:hypothetical protein